MLEILKNKDGFIIAVIEFHICNDRKLIDENGALIFINHIEVVDNINCPATIKLVIKIMLNKYKNLKTCYFYREYKYRDRSIRKYTRKQFERLVGE